jgi:dihydrofolate synthase/folylpolyglutamate synthase
MPGIIETVAKENKSPFYTVQGVYDAFEQENQAVAKMAMQLLGLEDQEKALQALPPCRLEEVKPGIFLDVAHNPDGLIHLFQALALKCPGMPIRVVCGLSKNKDLASCMAILRQHAAFIHLTEAPHERAASAEELASLLQNFPHDIERDVSKCVIEAQKAMNGEILLICGSFFIMAAARATFGISEPTDFQQLIERL